jgi:uncharacterized protein (TIGR02099 family)
MTLRKVGKILWYGCAGMFCAIGLSMLALKLAFDRAPHYQAEIKQWVHAQIGYHIDFAHVSPALRWYGPELYFERLELRSKDDRRVLAHAAGGRIAVDVWQLIHSGKLLAGRIELDSPAITLTRLADDGFALAAEIELRGGESAVPALTLDDLPAGTLAIRRGLIAIQSWNSELPRLELREVNLDLRRGDEIATLAATARLPPVLGGAVSVNGTARGFGPVEALSWTAVVRARQLSLDGWRALLPAYLSALRGGTGEFELAARGRGVSVTRADLDCGAVGVTTQLGEEPVVTFDRVSGAFTFTHAADRFTLRGRRVRALKGERQDPESEFDVSWREGDGGLLELRGRASYLRAETLLPLAGLLPQQDLRTRLLTVAPSGEWFDTHVDMLRGAAGDPWQLNLGARFKGLGFAPAGRAPGLKGLNGTIAGTELGGRIDIDTDSGVFAWPAQLAKPIELQAFKTTLYWKRTPQDFLVATPGIALKNHDASVQARVAWRQPADGSSPVLTLAASIDDGEVAQAHRYLPRALLVPSAFAWLNRALPAGHLSHADVVLQGPIRHFPFRDGSGLFLARAHMEGITVDYREGWPRAEALRGVAEFRNEGLSAEIQGGTIGNLTVKHCEARFADFKTAELRLHAALAGDAADAIGYLRATPLDALTEHAFSGVEGTGPIEAEVDLFLPFKEFDHRRTLVHAHLNDVSLMRPGLPFAATELNGDADIDGGLVSHADVHGRLLGGSFQMQGRSSHSRPVARTTLVFNGTFGGDAVRRALSLPAGIRIDGSTDWHGVLRMAPEPARERALRINASLAGLELNLPEPLAKPSGRPLPSSLDIQWPAGGGSQLSLTLGAVLRAQFNLDSDENGPTLKRAAVTFGTGSSAEPTFSDTQLLNTGGKIDRLDLAGWLRLYTPDGNAAPITNFLRSAKFEVAQIDYLGFSFLDVALDLALTESGWWRIAVGGPNVVGSILLPGSAESTEPWKLEFKRLKFTDGPSDAAAVADAAASDPVNPRHIPAINFHAAEAIWDERQFGDVRATLARLNDGIGLKQFTMTGVGFNVDAQGEWRGKDAGVGRIEGTLASTDVGGTMKQLGYAAVIEAKTGKMDFDLSWLGAPTADNLKDATGRIDVAIDKGQITGLNPGAGRVVGLASVAALPRRLVLDFSDLTDKGLAFDTARGDFELREGSAFTDDVLIKGPAAEIGLIGRVGLKNKDYDQTAVVTGNVSSSLPLAAFAAGPVIGGAVLLFTQVFKQPLKGLARGYYRITGSWDNPTVERIKSGDAAAATATATAEAPK